MQSKYIILTILLLVLVGAIGFLFITKDNAKTSVEETLVEVPVDPVPVETDEENDIEAEEITDGEIFDTAVEQTAERQGETVIGRSVNGKEIVAYHFGTGKTEILLVGGVHGGYSPSTRELADELMVHFEKNEDTIPKNLTLTIIPDLNPDGAERSGTEGRFNARSVDLNRNFDCEWNASAVWAGQKVSGGERPFSEPEAVALRDYVLANEPTAAIVWFSQEGKVYPSACGKTPSRQSVELAATFAIAAGYPSAAEFDAYLITGDMVNWMAKQGIPAISVLLSSHQDAEQTRNLAGVKAVLDKYAQ
jgi:hypothetical protein